MDYSKTDLVYIELYTIPKLISYYFILLQNKKCLFKQHSDIGFQPKDFSNDFGLQMK